MSDIRDGKDREATIALLEALTPVPLAPARNTGVRARVLAVAAPQAVVVRADERPWLPLLPGVALTPLRVDRDARTQTSLWRLEPGATIPPHDHTGEEECLVLEGSVELDGRSYGAGDFLLAPPGLHHTRFVSHAGAVLMIRGELSAAIDALFRAGGF